MPSGRDKYGGARLAALADIRKVAIPESSKTLVVASGEALTSALALQRGKLQMTASDEGLAGQLGALFLRWWFEGPHSFYQGKAFDWTKTERMFGKSKVTGDLRILMTQSMAPLGHTGYLAKIGVVKGEAVFLVPPSSIDNRDAVEFGRMLRAWFGDPNYQPLQVSIPLPYPADPTKTVNVVERCDIRVLVQSAFQGFARSVRIELAQGG